MALNPFEQQQFGTADVERVKVVLLYNSALYNCPGHPTPETNEVSYEREVYNYLMRRYQRQVRPVKKDTDTVDLTINLYINLLEDLVRTARMFYTVVVVVVSMFIARCC